MVGNDSLQKNYMMSQTVCLNITSLFSLSCSSFCSLSLSLSLLFWSLSTSNLWFRREMYTKQIIFLNKRVCAQMKANTCRCGVPMDTCVCALKLLVERMKIGISLMPSYSPTLTSSLIRVCPRQHDTLAARLGFIAVWECYKVCLGLYQSNLKW